MSFFYDYRVQGFIRLRRLVVCWMHRCPSSWWCFSSSRIWIFPPYSPKRHSEFLSSLPPSRSQSSILYLNVNQAYRIEGGHYRRQIHQERFHHRHFTTARHSPQNLPSLRSILLTFERVILIHSNVKILRRCHGEPSPAYSTYLCSSRSRLRLQSWN